MGLEIWYLELTEREQFIPSKIAETLELRVTKNPAINARFYRNVGASWQWVDRLNWTQSQWEKWVNREKLKTWVAQFEGKEVGYVEMEIQEGGSIEIVYFGLLPLMIGRGMGGGMLSLAVQNAWEIEGAQKVWVHTCSRDHPHALGNYEKRGFRLFQTNFG